MKKILLSLSVFAIAGLSALGQSSGNNGNHVAVSSFTITNYTMDYWASVIDPVIVATLKVKNNSSSSKTVNLDKIVIDTITGTVNSFCWGIYCWPDNIYTSPSPSVIGVGVSDSTFRGDYTINGKVGTTHMRYLFYNKTNISDSISVVIAYHVTPTGINPNASLQENKISSSPNPANSITAFGYSLNPSAQKARIVIHNMLGAVVDNISLDEKQSVVILMTDAYQAGIYFYSLEVDNRTVSTHKLVVTH